MQYHIALCHTQSAAAAQHILASIAAGGGGRGPAGHARPRYRVPADRGRQDAIRGASHVSFWLHVTCIIYDTRICVAYEGSVAYATCVYTIR